MRKLAIKLHLWLGLTIGLLWALQGLTGAGLVFHRELDRWAHPERAGSAGPMASMDRLVAAAAGGGTAPKRISVVDTGPDLVMADYDGADGTPRQLFLDAATARAVADRAHAPGTPGNGATSRFLYNLHERLTAGETGEVIVGSSGVLLFSSLALGLWIGWPRMWRAVAKVRTWRSRPQKLYGWHRLVGLSAGFALLLMVPCGIYMIFSAPIRNAVAAAVPHELPYKPAPLPAGAAAGWIAPQAAYVAAQRLFPDAAFVRLGMPSASAPAYVVRLLQPDEVRAWSGITTVTVDARSGAVLHVYDPLTAPLSNRVADAAFSVHNGEIAGTIGRLLVMLAGLSLPTFYVTGVWLWLTKRRRAAATRLAAAE